MASFVLELQKRAIDSSFPVADLLRMAFVVATKLDLGDFKQWAEKELKGYDDRDDKPAYRVLSGQPVAYDRVRGWERLLTYNLDPNVVKAMSEFKFHHPIGEIEADLKEDKTDNFVVSYSAEIEMKMINAMDQPAIPGVLISSSRFQGILDAVRTKVLEWSLKLDQAGIRGEDMVFADEEREAAKAIV